MMFGLVEDHVFKLVVNHPSLSGWVTPSAVDTATTFFMQSLREGSFSDKNKKQSLKYTYMASSACIGDRDKPNEKRTIFGANPS